MDGKTAGWLGLPQMGEVPWMMVRRIWSDQAYPASAQTSALRQ